MRFQADAKSRAAEARSLVATRCRVFICDYSRLLLANHQADTRQYPREACYPFADYRVRSPPDNVPNWEETARWTPFRESRPVKG
jgi:hypothetical protein